MMLSEDETPVSDDDVRSGSWGCIGVERSIVMGRAVMTPLISASGSIMLAATTHSPWSSGPRLQNC